MARKSISLSLSLSLSLCVSSRKGKQIIVCIYIERGVERERESSESMGSSCSARIKAESDPLTRPENALNTEHVVSLFPRTECEILGSQNSRSFSFSELRAATGNFHPNNVLGEDSFGHVFKGWIDAQTFKAARAGTGMAVSVKRLNPESFLGHKEWLTEIKYLGNLHHPNIMKLVGYCSEDDHRLVVYEFMPRGSLADHLFESSGFQPLSWNLRVKVALGVAKGLAHLHSPEIKVIHRDLKPSAILLDSNYNAKLSNFELAKEWPSGDIDHVSTRVMGTYGYAAPEYIATGHLTPKADVYGFGIVLLEMLTGKRVIDRSRPSKVCNLVDWARPYLTNKRQIVHFMDASIEGQSSLDGAVKAATIASKCLANDPRLRPTMDEVVNAFEQLQDTGIPTN